MQSIDDYLSTDKTSTYRVYLLREVLFGLREEYANNRNILAQLRENVIINKRVADDIEFTLVRNQIASKVIYKQKMIEKFTAKIAESLGFERKTTQVLEKTDDRYSIPQEDAIYFYDSKELTEQVESAQEHFKSMTYYGDKKDGLKLIITPSKVKATYTIEDGTFYTVEYDGINDIVNIYSNKGKVRGNILNIILNSRIAIPTDVLGKSIKLDKNGLSSKRLTYASRGTDRTGTYEIEDNGYSLHLKRHYR